MVEFGGQAFPVNAAVDNQGNLYYGDGGMWLRDYFAAKALPIIAGRIEKDECWNYAWIAEETYRMADAMIKAKDEKPDNTPTTL